MRNTRVEEHNRLHAGAALAAQLVLAKGFVDDYLIVRMQPHNDEVTKVSAVLSKFGEVIGDDHLKTAEIEMRRSMRDIARTLGLTPEQWAKEFLSIGRKRKAIELIERAIGIAQQKLVAAPAELRDAHPDKPDVPAECAAAYRRARDHLLANPHSPRWLALLLLTLARAIIGNTVSAFEADTWHEGTLFWIRLEYAWLKGDGLSVGQLLVDADTRLFGRRVANNLAIDMPRKLAEVAAITPTWAFFHPPW